MPAASTHIEFARDIYNGLSASVQSEITDLPMYFLGSQGPDMFFFSRAAILPHSLRRYGIRMHHEHIYDVISFFRTHCAKQASLASYFAGYLTHYALDVTMHPLISYQAQQLSNLGRAGKNENHTRIEATLDVWILKQKGKTIADYSAYRDLKVSDADRQALADMYHAMFLQVFQADIPTAEIARTIREAYRLLKALRPNHIFKYRLAQTVETLVRKPHLVSAMMLYDKEVPLALNQTHETFANPTNPADRRSFAQLYQDAGTLARKLLQDPDRRDFMADFLGNPL